MGVFLPDVQQLAPAVGALRYDTGGKRVKAKTRNSLDDSKFAYIDSEGNRKLPIHDASHVANAAARFGKTQFESQSAKKKAASKIRAAAKKHGVELSDDSLKMGEPLLIAGPKLDLAEGGEMVLLKVGEWDFGADSYGDFSLTPDDLEHIAQNFDLQVRRQDVPVVNEEHIPVSYSDAGDVLQGPGAIGWLKSLEVKQLDDGPALVAVPDWNAAGEMIAAADRYRAVSPELMRDWTDPETGESHGLTLTGVALTNYPRMKGLAGQTFAASERPRVLAFAEPSERFEFAEGEEGEEGGGEAKVEYAWPDVQRGPLHTRAATKGTIGRFLSQKVNGEEPSKTARDKAWSKIRSAAKKHGLRDLPGDWRELKAGELATWLMQEAADDTMEDIESGMLAPCIFQPPYATPGRCPGYTKGDPDGDGDADCCALAKGCNGYVPATDDQIDRATSTLPYYYAEGGQRVQPNKDDDKNKGGAAATTAPKVNAGGDGKPEGAPAAAPPPAAATAATAEEPKIGAEFNAANFAELRNLLLAERQERKAMEGRVEAAEKRANRAESMLRLSAVSERIEKLRTTGRITPAEATDLLSEENMAKFAEDDFVLKMFEKREEGSAVPLGQIVGSEGDNETADEDAKLDKAARALLSERSLQMSHKNYRAALLEVGNAGQGLGYKGGRR